MTSVADILSALGGPTAVARALHLRSSTVSEMKRRGSIPAEYWRDLVLAARRRGLTDITADVLMEIHARTAIGESQPLAGAATSHRTGASTTGNGHFSRFYGRARPHFASQAAVNDHVAALRDEWERP